MTEYNGLPIKKRMIFSTPWSAGYAAGWLTKKFSAKADQNAPSYTRKMPTEQKLENAAGTGLGVLGVVVGPALTDTLLCGAGIGTTVADGLGYATGKPFGALREGYKRGMGMK